MIQKTVNESTVELAGNIPMSFITSYWPHRHQTARNLTGLKLFIKNDYYFKISNTNTWISKEASSFSLLLLLKMCWS